MEKAASSPDVAGVELDVEGAFTSGVEDAFTSDVEGVFASFESLVEVQAAMLEASNVVRRTLTNFLFNLIPPLYPFTFIIHVRFR